MYNPDYELISPELYKAKEPIHTTTTSEFFSYKQDVEIKKPLIFFLLLLIFYVFEKTYGKDIRISFVTGMTIIIALTIITFVIYFFIKDT